MLRLMLCLVLLAPMASYAQGSLEVFDDPAFTQRAGTMTDVFKTLYMRVLPHPLSHSGIAGLEFRLTGLEGFLFTEMSWNASPNVVLGSLDTGINVAWPACQSSVTLAFTVFALEPPQNREIRVVAHSTPSNLNFDFPFLNNCEAPCIWCGAALEGEPYVLNPIVSVESTAWGQVKRLYQ